MDRLKMLALRLLRDEEGQDLIEYALLATFVSLVAIAGADAELRDHVGRIAGLDDHGRLALGALQTRRHRDGSGQQCIRHGHASVTAESATRPSPHHPRSPFHACRGRGIPGRSRQPLIVVCHATECYWP